VVRDRNAGQIRSMNKSSSDIFSAEHCEDCLKELSDPHRLRIVDALRLGELTVSDLSELLDAELVTISPHLKIMKFANMVKDRRDGKFVYYRLHQDILCSAPVAKVGNFWTSFVAAWKFRNENRDHYLQLPVSRCYDAPIPQ
jgi:DNA-binding transcriptional ArsR family regulator